MSSHRESVYLSPIYPRGPRNPFVPAHSSTTDMAPRPDHSLALPRLGGKSAVIIFILTLIGFVLESQLTQVRAYFLS